MKIYHSSINEKNSVEIGEEFVKQLLPGVHNSNISKCTKDWVKYLRISIAAIRLAEYDYLSPGNRPDWKSAKSFLFGKNNLFTAVCDLLHINKNMARLKIISYKKSGLVGDPIFGSITNEYTEKSDLALSPTSEDINKVIGDVRKKRES